MNWSHAKKKAAGYWAEFKSRAATPANDAIGFAGFALISYGAWLIVPAAGFICAGAFLVLISVARASE